MKEEMTKIFKISNNWILSQYLLSNHLYYKWKYLLLSSSSETIFDSGMWLKFDIFFFQNAFSNFSWENFKSLTLLELYVIKWNFYKKFMRVLFQC